MYFRESAEFISLFFHLEMRPDVIHGIKLNFIYDPVLIKKMNILKKKDYYPAKLRGSVTMS